jgi:hypothetical protein
MIRYMCSSAVHPSRVFRILSVRVDAFRRSYNVVL